ncbi:MAG: hypothetical protein JXL85_00955 [Bacilli bacterium]|jgi:hypothetical protein|nr:hypothetical protein [Bacilli bacterium]
MCKKIKIVLLALVMLSTSSFVFASQTVLDVADPSCSFVNYLNVGGGEALIEDDMSFLIDMSYGFQISPRFSIGAFIAVNPLSNFEHANLGISIADTEAAFALMSGMELLFTFSSDSLIHPFMRLAIGGISVGYLEDADDKEGYDGATADRSTFASISAGLELNITKRTRLALRGGWRFAAHEETMGIEEYGLGGPEVSLTLRTFWKMDINKN